VSEVPQSETNARTLAAYEAAAEANAVFLHLTPEELAGVLARTATAVAPGGLLAFTVKEGDGAAWSSHKLGRPRHFTYWREDPLRALIADSPWELESLERETGRKDEWLQCLCRAEAARRQECGSSAVSGQ